jgi:DNA-binding GntR family transcriptional regulator
VTVPANGVADPVQRGVLDGAGSKSDQVYRWLRDRLAAGALRPKHRVNADRISRDLQVSKIPVRAAIARLCADGALPVLPNAGAVVTPLSWRELADIQQSRLILEPPAAAAAAGSPTRADIAVLRGNVAAMRRWARGGDGDPFELNRSFHLALVSMAGNELLTALVDVVLQRVSRYRVLARHTPASARETATEHARIVAALAAGEADTAQRLMAGHLRSGHNVAADARDVDPRYFADEPPEVLPARR